MKSRLYLTTLLIVMITLLAFPMGGSAQNSNGEVAGTVTHGITSQPLAGVTVTLASAANRIDTIIAPFASDALVRFTATTDASGRYRFPNVEAGDYVIFAQGEELADLPAITVVVEAGVTETVDFSMTPGGSITGRITLANGSAASGGTITLFDRKLAVQATSVRADGSYLFEYVNPGNEYQLFVQTANEAAVSEGRQVVSEGSALLLDVTTTPAVRLSGRVLSDTGAPIERAIVSIESPTLRWAGLTDADGRYFLGGAGNENQNVVPGVYDLRVKADRHVSLFAESIDLSEPGNITRDFTLERAGVVGGTVTDDSGNPISNATVSAVGEAGAEYTTLTESDGSYLLDVLDPNQTYTVTAFFAGFVPARVPGIVTQKGQVLSGVDFNLTPGTLIEGSVSLPDGSPAATVVLDFYGAGGAVFSLVADNDGAFMYEGLEPGDYTVMVSTATQEFGFVGVVSVGASAEPINLELAATGSISGTAAGAGIVVVSFGEVVVSVQPVDPDGAFEVFGLPPADYTVVVYSEQAASEAVTVTLEAGSATDVTLTLE